MNSEYAFIMECKQKVLSSQKITAYEARSLINISDESLQFLSDAANEITRKFNGNVIDVETLINAKKGTCPEDCSFCSQSAFYKTGIDTYKLLPAETIVKNAKIAIRLKELHVRRYNHNLEAARSFFPKICTTHTYQERIDTNKIVKKVGLELCCGGIIGMGESRMQRLELGIDLSDLSPEECPINILVPQNGTPLELQTKLSLSEILRTIAVFRFLMPKTILKIAGGREVHLANEQEKVLLGGANGIITGGYLTIGGNTAQEDMQMISRIGLET